MSRTTPHHPHTHLHTCYSVYVYSCPGSVVLSLVRSQPSVRLPYGPYVNRSVTQHHSHSNCPTKLCTEGYSGLPCTLQEFLHSSVPRPANLQAFRQNRMAVRDWTSPPGPMIVVPTVRTYCTKIATRSLLCFPLQLTVLQCITQRPQRMSEDICYLERLLFQWVGWLGL